MNNVKVCILNHYTRDCSKLLERVKSLGCDVEVFTDTTNYYQKRNENRYLGLNHNVLSCLEHECEQEWKLIIHDDLIFDDKLFENIEYVLQFAPKTFVSFFNPRNQTYRNVNAKGKHVLKAFIKFWPQCMAFNSKEIPELVDFFYEHSDMGKISEDTIMVRYLSEYKIRMYGIVPSLVQHDLEDKSVCGNGPMIGKNRRDSELYNPDFDPKEIDWIKEFEDPVIDNKLYLDNKGIKNL